ncbi:hypothetical protein ColLi_12577 [Colletotrichum liriopes]|uniref:Uncharacterized protein n=1 Tax=Colletotrichum liriopes TaxID=708192 RepID=A0AA37LYV3_9PEZI|nr:hypothetical protein ColLi_12577 [Colletotrichum liriopes]
MPRVLLFTGAPEADWSSPDLLLPSAPAPAPTPNPHSTSTPAAAPAWHSELDTTAGGASQGLRSQFYDQSLALHHDLASSQLPPPPTPSRPEAPDTSRVASTAGRQTESFNNTTATDSFVTETTDSFQDTTGDPTTPGARPPLVTSHHLSDLEDIPPGPELLRLAPQTVTVNLVAGVMSVSEPRGVRTRWGHELSLVEVLVGDETRAGFGVTFWLPPDGGGGGDPSMPTQLRRQDVVLLQNVALHVFRGKVYGQSLRKGLTRTTVLYRRKLGEDDEGGYYRPRDLETGRREETHPQLAKTRRVWEWVLTFVGGEERTDPKGKKRGWDAPPDDTHNGNGAALALLLDTLPLETQAGDESSTRASKRDVEGVPQAVHVGLQHDRDQVRAAHLGQDAADLVRPGVDEDGGVDVGGVLGDPVDEPRLEQRLGNGDHDGAAEGLEELHAGRGNGDVLLGQDGLDDKHADLEPRADAEAGEDLVAEPLAHGRGNVKGRDHAGADGEQDHGGEDDGVVVADGGDQRAAGDGGDDGGQEEGQDLDAGLDGADTLDGLEVERWWLSRTGAARRGALTQVVDEGEEGGAEEAAEEHGADDVAVLEELGGQRALVALPELDADEDDDHEREADKQADDGGAVPGVLGAAPLQSEDQADDGGEEDGGADEVELQDALDESLAQGVVLFADGQEEEDEDHGNAADGQVDVEAPSPGRLLREDAAEQRPCHGGDAPHAADKPESQRPLVEGHRVAEDDNGAGEQTGGPDAGDGAADNEGGRVRRQGADEGADLEDGDGDEVGVLDAEELVDCAVHGLQGGRGEEVRCAIPANVLDAAVLRRDGAEGRGDDGLVQRDEEDGETERGDDEDELQAGRVHNVVVLGRVVVLAERVGGVRVIVGMLPLGGDRGVGRRGGLAGLLVGMFRVHDGGCSFVGEGLSLLHFARCTKYAGRFVFLKQGMKG